MKKITLLMAAALVGLSASAADLYVTGNNVEGETGSWNPGSPLVVSLVDGYYSFNAEGGFKISTVKGEWSAFEGGGYSMDGTWSMGTGTATCKLKKASNDFTTPKGGVMVSYKVAEDFSTITATWDAGDVTEHAWGIIGAGVGGWTDSDEIMLTKTGTDTYEWTGDINGEFKFRADNKWGNELTGAGNITANGTYNLSSGSANMTMYADNVTIVLHPNAQTMVVSGIAAGEVVLPEAFYILGQVNGQGWAPDNAIAMEKTATGFEASFTLGNAGEGKGYFSFTESTASDWDKLGQRWGATSGNYELKSGDSASIVEGENAFVAPADTNLHITLDWASKTFTVDIASGVASVEAADGEAVYFNMQGVRVANPENGLYIRVKNGKAVKVVK